jgi:predicted DNA binding protein
MIEECLEVTFEVTTDDCPLANASEQANTTIEARPPQLRNDGSALLKFSAPKSDDIRRFLDEDDRIKFLHRAESDDYDVYRCLSKQPCVVHDLVDSGFLADSIEYHNGRAVFCGAIVDREVLKNVIDRPDDAVTVRLRHLSPIVTEAREEVERLRNMTNRQEECLRTAVQMGYFSIPREVKAKEVAAELGISKSSFLERLRRAEREIFEEAFL